MENHSPTTVPLEPGDVFVVASDGVLCLGETPGTNDPRGAPLICRTIEKQHHGSASEFVECLRTAVLEAMTATRLRVDCSIVVVKRHDG